jgi:hypothetical protein
MIVTVKWLKEQNACEPGVNRFLKLYDKQEELKKVINEHIKDNTLDWANWLIVQKMTHKQQIRYAIFAAEQVLYLYEEKHPDDKRPRQAIEAAKAVLKKNNVKTREAAYAAAYDAANAAAYAAYAAAYAAYAAANAATYAAYAAYDAAYDAANAAANAAAYAAATYAAATYAMKIKILKYGLKLIYKEK